MKQNEMIDTLQRINTWSWSTEQIKALTQAIDQLRWRSVDDEFPEAQVEVMYVCKGFVSVGVKDIDDEDSNRWLDYLSTDCCGDYNDDYDVTHWKPIPQPPEES